MFSSLHGFVGSSPESAGPMALAFGKATSHGGSVWWSLCSLHGSQEAETEEKARVPVTSLKTHPQ